MQFLLDTNALLWWVGGQPMAVAAMEVIAHGRGAGSLPPHHRDPFDRMLIAQAQLEGLTIVTSDSRFVDYDCSLLSAR